MAPWSTHTDEKGNVLAVFDDGDLGVYRHKNSTADDISKRHNSASYTSAGGEKMGETWTELGFADFGYYEATGKIRPQAGAKIDFGSNWATEQVGSILDSDPSAGEYAKKAQGGGIWDVKAHSPGGIGYGSMLFGKYASARDAGNFAAGAVAANSYFPELAIDYGFGLYNMSGNNVNRAIGLAGRDVMNTPWGTIGSVLMRAKTGENPLSQAGIDAGKAYMKSLLNSKGGISSYFKMF
ncbi:hypothetical protein ACFOET_08290 [Parapedobacter deserti]|uniref:Bacterial toxin 44 domain-containing protein n=1 Tax=Parapedobacter deserti TaxID=1912957 RepID=A0ABV7JLB4_9SPHI